MRATTETLSQVTNLLAIVSAPPLDTATIRHIEVLLLQPQIVMVVIITSTGGVSKRVLTFPSAGRQRPGHLGGGVSQRAAHRRRPRRAQAARPPRATGRSRTASARFLDSLMPAFTDLAATAEDTLYVDGAARLLHEHRFHDLSQINALMQMLERRVTLLEMLRDALGDRSDVVVRIGAENEAPGAALAGDGRRGLRPAAAPARHRLAHRAGRDGLRDHDRRRARGRRAALPLRRRRLRRR